MALKKTEPAIQMAGAKVAADELDLNIHYAFTAPLGGSSDYFGSTAAGTRGQVKPLVITYAQPDYSRNVLVSVAGSANTGGTFVINGLDQFGHVVSESIAVPATGQAGTQSGTKIFDAITSGTFTFSSTCDPGLGSPSLGVAEGTEPTNQAYFGLPVRIGAVTDVKKIIYNNTPVNGGTINGTFVQVSTHSFRFPVLISLITFADITVRSSYSSEENIFMN